MSAVEQGCDLCGLPLPVAESKRRALWAGALTAPVVLGAGRPFFDQALKLARHRAAFVLLGRWLEERAKGKASDAIRRLIDLQPATATLRRDGAEIVVPVDGHRVVIGNARLLDDPQAEAVLAEIAERGQTPVGMCVDGKLVAAFAIADPARPGAPAAIAALHAMGVRTIMATGDVEAAARAIAKVAEMVALSRRTMTIIRQNLVWAMGYNTVAIPGAAIALSSVSVVANSLRLQKDGR